MNSLGGMPSPLSSTEVVPLPKSTLTSTLHASASNELAIRPRTTLARDGMVVDDLICAATWGGRGRIGGVLSGIRSRCLLESSGKSWQWDLRPAEVLEALSTASSRRVPPSH